MQDALGICAAHTDLRPQAESLATRLALPCYPNRETAQQQTTAYLYVTPDALQFCSPEGEIQADFVAGHAAHRRRFGGGRKQPIARAIGLKSGFTPSVIDATAGLGRDAFVFASLGCKVQMLERHAVVAALLEDAVCRAGDDEEIGEWVKQRLHVQHADAIHWLENAATAVADVIYLDPMYPERKKTARVKKEMRVLQYLLGQDMDTAQLLQAALSKARRRVVVKRPKNAPVLTEIKPSTVIASKNTRYDIYIKTA